MSPKAEKILASLLKRKAEISELELARGIQQASRAGALGREIGQALEISPQSVSRISALLDPTWEADLPALEYRSSTLMDWRALPEAVRDAARTAFKSVQRPFTLNDLRRLRHAACTDPKQVYEVCEHLVIPRAERSIRVKEGRPTRTELEQSGLVDDAFLARLQRTMEQPYGAGPSSGRVSMVQEEGRYVSASAAKTGAVPTTVQIPLIAVPMSVAVRLLVALGGDPRTSELLLEAELIRRLEAEGGMIIGKLPASKSGGLSTLETRLGERIEKMQKIRAPRKRKASEPAPETP